MEPHVMTIKGFLHRFLDQHNQRPDHPFCFILGAGASKTSGIPTGEELAKQWIEEIWREKDFDNSPLEEWATPDNLGIDGFALESCANYYPEIYERRFGDQLDNGYAFLESKMDGKDPSFGYAVLAYIMSETGHRIVVTTNFDNLIGDALSIHSKMFPLVIGHDALAGFAKVDSRRPLIAKVHGAIGFSPKNGPNDIRSLSEEWKKSLTSVFQRCTPIVIGYSGNDGSLMNLLESLPEGLPDCVFWLTRCTSNSPLEIWCSVSERIQNFISAKKGHLVPIPGFDEVMLLLHKDLKIPSLYDRLKERSDRRLSSFDNQDKQLSENLRQQPEEMPSASVEPIALQQQLPVEILTEVVDAVKSMVISRKEKPWWAWDREAKSTSNIEEKERIYQEAIKALPNNAPILDTYAVFLKNKRKDFDKAEEFFKRALEADPTYTNSLGNYATFLSVQRKDFDKAEEFYRSALEVDPKNAATLGNYAVFLKNQRKDIDKAEEFYKRAFEADPTRANNLGNYAYMLLALGRNEEGRGYLSRAELYLDDNLSLQIELQFYRAAHDPASWPSILVNIADSLKKGARSPDWNLEDNIKRAEMDNHPNVPLLRALARVITEGEDISILSAFPEWPGSETP